MTLIMPLAHLLGPVEGGFAEKSKTDEMASYDGEVVYSSVNASLPVIRCIAALFQSILYVITLRRHLCKVWHTA